MCMAILVIADDLTGAAEIGGIILRHGLSVEIVHTLETSTNKDVRILNTNTRSLKEKEALSHLKELFSTNPILKWDWIYLKFDSALRGHIAAEISFYCRAFQKDNVVFCPVNPTLGRVIEDNGWYWVDGKPIAETDFAQDPEFPIEKSGVLEVLGGDYWHLVKDVQGLSTEKSPYIVAAVNDLEGLHKWASTATSFGIYAGAAAFFEALLLQRKKALPMTKDLEPWPQSPILYVCGSNHENSIKRIAKVDANKVVYWQSIGEENKVAMDVLGKIEKFGKVILTVARTVSHDAQTIRACMAEIVGIVQQTCPLQELVIEGGATARAVLEVLDIDTLLPVREYGPGVIRNHVPGVTLAVTLKPGSYPWTENLWVF
ncbi:four-carbon acid sugar kinase family protein [Sphingobacterium phlebotomi]|uniref:Four-carbon acid sugar kinase family protein n=2 Tax=Sphingobacterium phlebotomi TaxID=2605433 RepID=A0A5D4HA05_9SPHI|nr:four-carbon acid sugar kinase family protein [Sphingobacterium phlebotomi]